MNKLLRILCSVFIFIAFVFNASHAYAKADMLNSVVVSDSPNGGYNIVLGTSTPAKYSIQKMSANKIILKINNTVPSSNISAISQNASNLEHVIIKPDASGTIIEISGANASKSSINLLGGVKKSSSIIWQIFLLLTIIGVALQLKKKKRKEYSTKISIAEEENQILKVSFERKGGLIARGTGAKRAISSHQNVRKVTFENDSKIRELNIR